MPTLGSQTLTDQDRYNLHTHPSTKYFKQSVAGTTAGLLSHLPMIRKKGNTLELMLTWRPYVLLCAEMVTDSQVERSPPRLRNLSRSHFESWLVQLLVMLVSNQAHSCDVQGLPAATNPSCDVQALPVQPSCDVQNDQPQRKLRAMCKHDRSQQNLRAMCKDDWSQLLSSRSCQNVHCFAQPIF